MMERLQAVHLGGYCQTIIALKFCIFFVFQTLWSCFLQVGDFQHKNMKFVNIFLASIVCLFVFHKQRITLIRRICFIIAVLYTQGFLLQNYQVFLISVLGCVRFVCWLLNCPQAILKMRNGVSVNLMFPKEHSTYIFGEPWNKLYTWVFRLFVWRICIFKKSLGQQWKNAMRRFAVFWPYADNGLFIVLSLILVVKLSVLMFHLNLSN